MPTCCHRLLALLGVACVLTLSGVPLAVVQVWGWATMVGRFAELMPVDTAIAYTLTGQEVCGVCSFVQGVREKQSLAPAISTDREAKLLPPKAERVAFVQKLKTAWMIPLPWVLPEAPEVETQGPPPRSAWA